MPSRPSRSSPQLLSVLLLVAVIGLLVYLSTHPAQLHNYRTPREERGRARRQSEPERQQGERGPRRPADCRTLGIACTSRYDAPWSAPAEGSCATIVRAGSLFPDPRCTPGGVDPSVTEATLHDPAWTTRCDRNCATSEAEKHVTYGWYGIAKPRANSGESQVCELDHLVPLELGGADGLGNIWPECGPAGAPLRERNFKIKDRVENYLADEVRAGRMPLVKAQHGIAADWAQYLPAANRYCQAGGRC